jgi:ankyrin repeat protein
MAAGADPDVQNADGATPLSRAARWCHEDAARALLQCGANRHVADHANRTPLEWATAKGHDELVTILQKPKHRASSVAMAAIRLDGADGAPAGAEGAAAAPGARSRRSSQMRDNVAAMASHRNSVALHAHAVANALAAASGANNSDGGGVGTGSGGGGGGAPGSVPGGDAGANADVNLDGVDPRGRAFTHPDEYIEMTPMRVEGWMAKQGHFIR